MRISDEPLKSTTFFFLNSSLTEKLRVAEMQHYDLRLSLLTLIVIETDKSKRTLKAMKNGAEVNCRKMAASCAIRILACLWMSYFVSGGEIFCYAFVYLLWSDEIIVRHSINFNSSETIFESRLSCKFSGIIYWWETLCRMLQRLPFEKLQCPLGRKLHQIVCN